LLLYSSAAQAYPINFYTDQPSAARAYGLHLEPVHEEGPPHYRPKAEIERMSWPQISSARFKKVVSTKPKIISNYRNILLKFIKWQGLTA
jgi:hypothetical protein